MGATISYCTIFFFIYAFDCSPEYYSWHVSFTTGKCIEINDVNIGIGAVNLVTDSVIFLMPLPLIWKTSATNQPEVGTLGCVRDRSVVSISPALITQVQGKTNLLRFQRCHNYGCTTRYRGADSH